MDERMNHIARYGQIWFNFDQNGSFLNLHRKSETVIFQLQRLGLKQQAVSRGLSTSDHFLAKKLSKYRLKQPKYIVLGTPKKPDKIPKMAKIDFE